MKPWLIGILVAVAVVGMGYFVVTQFQSVARRGDAISGGVVTRYVELLKQEHYGEAWDTCLSESYQAQTSRAEFIAAHQARRQKFGPLTGWTQTDYQHEANLFNDESLIGINGQLHYSGRDVFFLYKVDSAVQPYLIKELVGGEGNSTNLSSGVW